VTSLELVLEMNMRGFKFLPCDLYKSDLNACALLQVLHRHERAALALTHNVDGSRFAQSAQGRERTTSLELVLEMNMRGFKFLPCDLYKSDLKKFKMEGQP